MAVNVGTCSLVLLCTILSAFSGFAVFLFCLILVFFIVFLTSEV